MSTSRMSPPLRVLVVEDSDDDAVLLQRHLRRVGFDLQFERVETPEQMKAALARQPWDIVLSDYTLPHFNAPTALALLKESGIDLPFIIISGTIGEETAVAALQAGAHDFLMKTNLTRLVPAIERGLREAEQRRERHRAEEALREAHQRLALHVENTPLAVIEWDKDFCVSRWSPSAEELFGWRAEEVLGKCVSDWRFVFSDDVEAVNQIIADQRDGTAWRGVSRNRNYTKDGSVLHCEWYNSVLYDQEGRILSVQSLVLDVTAREFAQEERAKLLQREQEARRQAEEASRLKDEFLATVSHELRTPLTSILGWSSILRNTLLTGEDMTRAVEAINRNAHAQAQIIDELLEVSRIITGNLSLDMRAVSLSSIVEGAIESVRPAAEAKRIRLLTSFAPDVDTIRGDLARLRQVVWNLLSNALKFTPIEGTVEVGLSMIGSAVRLVVKDTGEGISSEFLPFVFDRFRQADGTSTRRHGGLGLGLAIVRHLVELHGGSVYAESEGIGHGATITVDLPTLSAQGKTDGEVNLFAGSPGVEDITPPARIDGFHVLVVEDDGDTLELLMAMLKQSGAEVTGVSSAADALRVFEELKPDVVISDLGMPGEDGYSLIGKIRQLKEECGGATPAIALSGYAGEEDRKRALAAGFQRHIAKPIEAAHLTQAIADLLGTEKTSGKTS